VFVSINCRGSGVWKGKENVFSNPHVCSMSHEEINVNALILLWYPSIFKNPCLIIVRFLKHAQSRFMSHAQSRFLYYATRFLTARFDCAVVWLRVYLHVYYKLGGF